MLKTLCFIIGLSCLHNVLSAAGQKYDLLAHVQQAKDGEFPFVVSLQNKDRKHFCVGSLVTLSYILTACHCLGKFFENGQFASIGNCVAVGGSVDITPNGKNQVRDVLFSVTHPECGKEELGWVNDYGLCKTKEPFEPGPNLNIMKAFSWNKTELEEETDYLIGNRTICKILGWGAQNSSLDGSYHNHTEKLVKLNVFLEERHLCSVALCALGSWEFCGHMYALNRGQLCAYLCRQEHACMGASGGPIYCNGYVYGFVSWRYRCGETWSPTMFSRLDHGFDFIAWGRTDPVPLSKCSIVRSSMSILSLLTVLVFSYEK